MLSYLKKGRGNNQTNAFYQKKVHFKAEDWAEDVAQWECSSAGRLSTSTAYTKPK